MRRQKTKHYLILIPAEATLALRALLSFRNKIISRGIDSVDVDRLIRNL